MRPADRDLVVTQATPRERAEAIYALLDAMRYWESRFTTSEEERFLAFVAAQIEAALDAMDDADVEFVKGPSPYDVIVPGEGYRLGDKEASS